MTFFKRELSVRGTAADLPRIADFIEAACEAAHINQAARFDLNLAVEEACCNIMEHAYENEGGPFSVCFETYNRDAVITLQDHGRPFDPSSVAPPDLDTALEDRPIGGFGLHLMRKLMDEVRFTFDSTGNTLVMVKRKAVNV
jgi:anti-sigma regulatory factor (Ser/Thr protein kinase)